MKEDEMGETCSMFWGDDKCIQNRGLKTSMEKATCKTLCVDRMIILKWAVEE
jgi:hypothetical protein